MEIYIVNDPSETPDGFTYLNPSPKEVANVINKAVTDPNSKVAVSDYVTAALFKAILGDNHLANGNSTLFEEITNSTSSLWYIWLYSNQLDQALGRESPPKTLPPHPEETYLTP